MTTPRPSNSDDSGARSVASRHVGAETGVPSDRGRDRARTVPAIERALTDLATVTDLIPFLALLRDPAARRPWREVHLDPYARAEADAQAREERAERVEIAPGEHTDAARADVLDLLSGVLWRAESLAEHLSRAAWCPALPAAPADGDPRPYLARARACLVTAVTGWANGDEIAWWAADTAAAMLADLASALALNVAGHVVKAVCPWCKGGLSREWTWRVRILVDEPAIVCESGVCNPPARDAGTWWRGQPAWRFRDWDWLAARLWHLDRRHAAETPPPPPYASFAGWTGRAGSPTTAAAEREILAGLAPEPTDEGTAA